MDPWSGDQYPTYHLVWPKIKGKKERKKKKKTDSQRERLLQGWPRHHSLWETSVLAKLPHTPCDQVLFCPCKGKSESGSVLAN